VHLVIRARDGAPFWLPIDDGACVRVGDEASAKWGWRGRVRRLAQPPRDEVRGERAHGPKLGQTPAGFLDRGRLLGPHERGSRRTAQRALFASFAALGLEREEFSDVAVVERLYAGN